MKLIALTLLAIAGAAGGSLFAEVNLRQHLEKLFENRYPHEANNATRESIRDYIKTQFLYFGLDVQEQKFNTTVNTDPRGLGSSVTVEGTNIIGIQKAITRQSNAVIVVGADYDSNGISDPLFYNGAGLAALLEIAHVYCFNVDWSGRFDPNFTTVFVAFDINSKHYQSSTGRPGGYYFVNEWLWTFLENNPHYFGGAVILDSVMNVNYDPNSQTVTPDFKKLFPDTYQRVLEGQNKGDFLAMVSMTGSEDSTTLKDQFSAGYNRDRRARRYRLEDMVLQNGASMDPMVQLFVQSENIHFWTFKPQNKSIPFPAILLTDTINYRTNPKDTCVTCRPTDFLTEDRLEFVNATVRATTHFLLDRQATLQPPEVSSAMLGLPSMIMTAVMMMLVRLYM